MTEPNRTLKSYLQDLWETQEQADTRAKQRQPYESAKRKIPDSLVCKKKVPMYWWLFVAIKYSPAPLDFHARMQDKEELIWMVHTVYGLPETKCKHIVDYLGPTAVKLLRSAMHGPRGALFNAVDQVWPYRL